MYTDRQQAFVDRLLLGDSLGDAAKRAGLSRGYAYSLVKRPEIKELLAKEKRERAERLNIDKDWVLSELVKLYQTSVADFLQVPTDGGAPYFDLSKADPARLAAIDSLQMDSLSTTGAEKIAVDRVKIKLSKRLELLKQIGRHVDIDAWNTKIELNAGEGLAKLLKGALEE